MTDKAPRSPNIELGGAVQSDSPTQFSRCGSVRHNVLGRTLRTRVHLIVEPLAIGPGAGKTGDGTQVDFFLDRRQQFAAGKVNPMFTGALWQFVDIELGHGGVLPDDEKIM